MSNDKNGMNEEFSLESIIAEFAGDSSETPAPKTDSPEHENPPPAASDSPEQSGGNTEAEERVSDPPEKEAEEKSENEAPSSDDGEDESQPELFRNIRKSVSVNSRPVPSAEELRVDGAETHDDVIDLGAYDNAYRKRQHSIRNMRRQLRANDRAIKKLQSEKLKKRNITALMPATLNSKTGIPVPEGLRKSKKNQPKVSPRQMLRKLDKELRSLTVRSVLAFIFCLPLAYMTAASYLKLPLPDFMSFSSNPITFTIISLVLLSGVILCAYDIYFGGCYSLITFKATGDSLIFASSIASIGHCIVSMLDKSTMYGSETSPVYVPVCILPALGLLVSLIGDRIRVRAYRSSLIKTHRLEKASTIAPLRDRFDGSVVYASAPTRDLSGFFRSFAENDAVTTMMHWYAPLLIAATILLSVYCSYYGNGSTPFFWNWSVIIGFTPALGFFLAYVLPYARLSKRLAKNGVSAGGISACARLADRSFVMLRDRDMFPAQSVSIKAVRPSNAGDYPLCITASVLSAADTSLAEPFLALVRKQCIPLFRVKNLSISDSGGYSGVIEGHKVLVGTCSFLQRSGVKTPEDISLRTALCCAVDGALLAVYAMRYEVSSSCDYAMSLFDGNGYFPILATRDVNITSAMVQDSFGIPSTEVVYPSAEVRTVMSDSRNTLEASAVVTLQPTGSVFAQTLVGCHRFKSTARLGLIFSVISSLIGLAFGTIMAYFGWYEAATPVNMLLYYVLWLVPVLVFSGWVNRY